jgi:hypothetical protein
MYSNIIVYYKQLKHNCLIRVYITTVSLCNLYCHMFRHFRDIVRELNQCLAKLHTCVTVWMYVNGWNCVCVGFVICGCFGNMCTCIYCVLYCLYCVFVLFDLCIFILICFVCTGVRTAVLSDSCLYWCKDCCTE